MILLELATSVFLLVVVGWNEAEQDVDVFWVEGCAVERVDGAAKPLVGHVDSLFRNRQISWRER